jgi:hypothetical protein
MGLEIGTPFNNTTESTPAFLDWMPTSNEKVFYYAPAVSNVISPSMVEINVKDVIDNPEFSQYSEFRISAVKNYQGTPPFNWIVAAPILEEDGTTSSDINSETIALTDNETIFKYLVTLFANLSLMPVSSSAYEYKINFLIEGKTAADEWIDCATYTYTIKLFVVSTLALSDPSFLRFLHYQGTPLPTKTVNINGANWTLEGMPNFILSSSTPGVTINTITPSVGEPYMTATGNGIANVDVTLGDFYDEGVIDIDNDPINKRLTLYQGETLVRLIPIRVVVRYEASLDLSPEEISFSAVKEIQEPEAVFLEYGSSNPVYTITTSPWLTFIEETREISPGIFAEVLTVKPIPTSNMAVGIYTGFVKIAATTLGLLSEKTTIVNYELQGFIASPYPVGTKAFTLDPKYFNLYTNNANTFFQLVATIKVFDFFTFAETTKVIPEKIPLINGKASVNYGQTIHRIMKKFTDVNQNYFQYKLAPLSLFVQEVSISDRTIVREGTLPKISFVAGLSFGKTTIGFLEFNPKPSRVTINSFYFLNILIPGYGYELRIFKNGVYQSAIPLDYLDEIIVTKKIDFVGYRQADFIEYSLNQSTDNTTQKTIVKAFNIFPEGKYSCNIRWENEFLVQSILECTGGISIKADFENRTSQKYINMVEVLDIITNTKVNKLIISTGWLSRNDIDSIESLMRSKRVWIELPGKIVSLRPIGKGMPIEDTQRELIDYPIEFQINRNYNEETYSL